MYVLSPQIVTSAVMLVNLTKHQTRTPPPKKKKIYKILLTDLIFPFTPASRKGREKKDKNRKTLTHKMTFVSRAHMRVFNFEEGVTH